MDAGKRSFIISSSEAERKKLAGKMDDRLHSWRRKPPGSSRSSAKAPKVVTIPVRFVGSDQDRCKSAIRIQRVVRGFLARKNVNKIMSAHHVVCNLERKISRAETIESIRRDARERLKVNETLMEALLKLDSVRGVDSCVRDLRKTVITKAIALQDMMEEVVDLDDQSLGSSGNWDEIRGELDVHAMRQSSDGDADDVLGSVVNSSRTKCDAPISLSNRNRTENELPQSVEFRSDADFMENDDADTLELQAPAGANHLEEREFESVSATESKPLPNEVDLELDDTPGGVDGSDEENEEAGPSASASQVGSSDSPQCAMEEDAVIGRDEDDDGSGNHENVMELYSPDGVEKNPPEEKLCFVEGDDENRNNREMLQRMLEDNERMMTLMSELLEKSVMQTQFLNSVSKRVELLERTLTLDRSSRSRRKKNHDRGFL